MHVEEHQELCVPGTFVYVPANVVHTFVVASEEPGKKLNLFSPAAMVGFFEELAEQRRTAQPPPSAWARSARSTTWESSAQCRTPISDASTACQLAANRRTAFGHPGIVRSATPLTGHAGSARLGQPLRGPSHRRWCVP